MLSEDLLRRLQQDLTPSPGARDRIRMRLQNRVAAPEALRATKALLTPTTQSKRIIWERISASLVSTRAHSVLTSLRAWLVIPEGLDRSLWFRLSPQLQPMQRSRSLFWGMKWVAAAVLVVFVMQLSPRLLMTPQTVAGSESMLLPHGEVSILLDSVWEPVTEEVSLRAGMRIRTGADGQASITLGDDGVVRLDHSTMVDLVDLSDRAEPAGEIVPTLSVYTGRIWMQGLVPASLRGITVFSPVGLITVQEGSVSISGEKSMQVQVYDRRAQVARDGGDTTLVAGETMTLRESGISAVLKIVREEYGSDWVEGNLTLDAIHRQEIAALQQARMAQRARILPTSTLYPVKRAVEAVDLFLTIGEEAKIQKQIQQADTRLTEAAALLANGQTGAVAVPLEEYRSTLVALATGSGDATLAQFLLKQVVAQNTSDISAMLPSDEGYILKKAVLETSTELSNGVVAGEDVRGGLLLDALTTLTQTIDSGNLQALSEVWAQLQPQIQILKTAQALELKPDVRRQSAAMLAALSLSMKKQEVLGQIQKVDPILLQQIMSYLPAEDIAPILNEEDLQILVAGIKQRIFVYHLTQARLNQFSQEIKSLEDNPDHGRILRRLYFALPGGPENFPERVRQEIMKLGWQRASEQ